MSLYAWNGTTIVTITEREVEQAEVRLQRLREAGHVVSARYDRYASRLVLALHTGAELAVPVSLIEGLDGATVDNLAEIEISPTGLGLHWPSLDADVYVPALLEHARLKQSSAPSSGEAT